MSRRGPVQLAPMPGARTQFLGSSVHNARNRHYPSSGHNGNRILTTTWLRTTELRRRDNLLSSGMAIVWAIALAKLILHIYFNNRYGYFRDEFDYMSCGDHLQWGYVDQPPLIPFLIHVSRAVLGDSLRAIRFIPRWRRQRCSSCRPRHLARELGGRALCPDPHRNLRRARAAISLQRRPARHQLP